SFLWADFRAHPGRIGVILVGIEAREVYLGWCGVIDRVHKIPCWTSPGVGFIYPGKGGVGESC
ncbi:MAG: hypothetical protein R6W84_04395, partial [Promethearchaeia archaeon]